MEYHKIETLYERDEATHKVKPGVLKNRTYDLLKVWRWTEKVDGTNFRVIYQNGKLSFGGKTDTAQLSIELIKWADGRLDPGKLEEMFPTTADANLPNVVLYGEGYGAGVQKGGGDYSATKKVIFYDVLVAGKWWLSHENVLDVLQKLSLEMAPDFGVMTLEEASELVRAGFASRCAVNVAKRGEGLVGAPA